MLLKVQEIVSPNSTAKKKKYSSAGWRRNACYTGPQFQLPGVSKECRLSVARSEFLQEKLEIQLFTGIDF